MAARNTSKGKGSRPAKRRKAARTNGLANTALWRCMNCGQQVFVAVSLDPPDVCQYCRDMTTWQCIES